MPSYMFVDSERFEKNHERAKGGGEAEIHYGDFKSPTLGPRSAVLREPKVVTLRTPTERLNADKVRGHPSSPLL